MKLFKVLVCLFFLWIPFIGFAEPIKIEFLPEKESIQPEQPFWTAVHLIIEDGWHTYWKNPGDAGLPLQIEWKLPYGFQAEPIAWPTPEKFDVEGMIGFGYEKEVTFLIKIIPPKNLDFSVQQDLQATIKWLVCSSSTCLPGQAEVKLSLPASNAAPAINQKNAYLFAAARDKQPHEFPHISVLRKDGSIQIQIPSELHSHLTDASLDFYPEKSQEIDCSKAPFLSLSKESQEAWALLSENSEKGKDHSSHLKGLLVIKNKNDPSTIALSIDHPIKDEEPHLAINLANSKKNVASTASIQSNTQVAHPPEFEGGLILALGFAFLGGMILNLMPCVLPVISFKIMSFVKMAGQKRGLIFRHGLAFSSGVIVSFWSLAGLMIFLQSYGKTVGWGFQLQEPIFVAFLAAVLLIFGLNMFGVFESGLGFASWAGQMESDSSESTSFLGSFISGVLATAVATPCTGPFLGSAMGFAFTLPAPLALLVFTSLGLGMAFPYLLFSAFPPLLKFLPRPGPWMITFKELMGFVMLATVLWLVWVFGAQTTNLAVTLLLSAFLFIALACWIYGKWSSPMTQSFGRIAAYLSALSLLALGGVTIMTAVSSNVVNIGNEASVMIKQNASIRDWEPFSLERITELGKKGIPVFVDFTAKWCLICQANHLVLSQDHVVKELASAGVVKMKADWTKNDELITQELKKFGRSGVPLYVFYGADTNQTTHILPQVLTADVVLEHLNSLSSEIAEQDRR